MPQVLAKFELDLCKSVQVFISPCYYNLGQRLFIILDMLHVSWVMFRRYYG